MGLAISRIGDMDWLDVEKLGISQPLSDRMATFRSGSMAARRGSRFFGQPARSSQDFTLGAMGSSIAVFKNYG